MRKVLEEFYYGNITPNQKSFTRNSPYAKAMDKLSKSDAYLQGILNEDGKAMLKAFEEAQDEVNSIGILEAFVDGYRLGARFMASYMTLHRELTSNALALCCLHDGALETYLKENPQIKTIVFCLDADQWGRKYVAEAIPRYKARGYTVYNPIPPQGKDWNEYLCLKKQKSKERGDAR